MDIKYDSNFDLQIGNDLYITTKAEFDQQMIELKLNGVNPDFILHPTLCCSYEDFVGENNDASTGEQIVNRTYNSLIIPDIIDNKNLEVDAYPTGHNTIQVNVKYTEYDGGYIETIYEKRAVTI